ncbi:3-deoxy-D-manno-octulosonic acid transferase [Alienimonas californiensis]|uniref:3-deoxy-D-manno-octulosonic acid transferase n=1 Tax=Alienimonas californiensis TaxID=2527989 RepID=A0A517PFC6_9PLAN|nr:glycosyltransferase N-terminal domain-containing protein [Alienimonas californiensis]QDT18076.1 3-deoxy-D-manno-octulosonic acid transferase [Alienimonas californiensis]
MPHLFNAAYLLTLVLATPLLAWRRLVQGKDRSGWKQKLTGRVEPRTEQGPCVWWHAVSVGEVLQLPNLIAAVRERRPDAAHVVTVSTGTGLDVARRKLPDVDVHQAPLDFSWAIDAFLARTRPSVLALVELELWPNLVRRCEAAGVPVAVVNGRLSANSFRGYRRIRPLIRGTFARLGWVGTQTEEYADRFVALGTDPARVAVTGSVKFDGLHVDPANPATQALREAFGLHPAEQVLLAGSTGDPEEAIVLDAYQQIRLTVPDCRLLIAPRHAERFDAVAALVAGRDVAVRRLSRIRSEGGGGRREGKTSADSPISPPSSPLPPHPVLLLDTLGDLSAAWGLATVAFVGGSLNDRGGQNMLEPAAYGAAVTLGPNTRNFADVVAKLTAADAVVEVTDAESLAAAALRFLEDPAERSAIGARAQRVIRENAGATAGTADALVALLPVGGVAADTPLARAA